MATAQPKNAMPAGDSLPEKTDSDNKGQQQQKERVYAGTFKSDEELEKGYVNLKKSYDTQGNEIGTLRANNQSLQQTNETLQRMLTTMQENNKPAQEPEPPKTDYEAELQNIRKEFKKGNIDEDELVLRTNKLTALQVSEDANQKLEKMRTELQNSFNSQLSERDQQVMLKDFHDKYPDFQELVTSGKLEEVKSQNPLHDDFSAYWALKAQEAFEKGKQEQSEISSGSENTNKVLSDPGTSMQTPKTKPTSEADIKASMLAAAKNTEQ